MIESDFFVYFLLALALLLLIVIAYMAYLLGKRKVLLEPALNGSPTLPTNRKRNLSVPPEQERSCVQDESMESAPGASALPQEIVYSEPNYNAIGFNMMRLNGNPLPEMPQVTYTKVQPKHLRNGNIERYDVSVNNSFIHRAKQTSPYNYNFSSNSKTPPIKYSLEHIYDETQFPTLSEVSSTTDKTEETDETDANYSKPMVAK